MGKASLFVTQIKGFFLTILYVLQKTKIENKISMYLTKAESVSYIRDLNESEKHCLSKFVALTMRDGKKTLSHTLLKTTLNELARYGDAVSLLMKAVDNVQPILEVKKKRIAGRTQFVPSIVSKKRQNSLAIRWILEAARKRRVGRKTKDFSLRLAAELLDAAQKIGNPRQKRDELHRLAESNRGFSHYRWW
jgi:small subunit ribosomal protein S7